MDAHIYNLLIRVLVYKEDKDYVAHALELDILGYGKTGPEAIRELGSLIDSQLSFALKMKDDSLLSHPAPREYFERWDEAQSAALRKEVLQDTPGKMDFRAIFFSLDGRINKLPKSQFHRVNHLTCAEAS